MTVISDFLRSWTIKNIAIYSTERLSCTIPKNTAISMSILDEVSLYIIMIFNISLRQFFISIRKFWNVNIWHSDNLIIGIYYIYMYSSIDKVVYNYRIVLQTSRLLTLTARPHDERKLNLFRKWRLLNIEKLRMGFTFQSFKKCWHFSVNLLITKI